MRRRRGDRADRGAHRRVLRRQRQDDDGANDQGGGHCGAAQKKRGCGGGRIHDGGRGAAGDLERRAQRNGHRGDREGKKGLQGEGPGGRDVAPDEAVRGPRHGVDAEMREDGDACERVHVRGVRGMLCGRGREHR